MDRQRGGGDRFTNNGPTDSQQYRYPRGRGGGGGGPPPPRSSDETPINRNRGGFSGNRRPYDSSPPHYSLSSGVGGGGAGGFRPVDGDGGFRPMGGRGARNFNNYSSEFEVPLSGQKRFNPEFEVPMSGQKRPFPFPGRGGGSPPERLDGGSFDKNFDGSNFDKKHVDGGSFAKLFVGSVPKTATEDDIRPVFEEHGNVVEVALIKDKRTGQQQGQTLFASAGCCFIKYATSEEADRAIHALHNQYILPGGMGPIQVRYADGERERLVEFKLFVGSLNKQATEKEVEDIFVPYGRVEDVYLMRDEMKQSRGCGFVKYANRDMAMAAISALNGVHIMRGCDQPLIVRFAEPKRPRPGETRGPGAPAFGGPGFGPRAQPPGLRPPANLGEAMHVPIPSNAWNPMNQQNMVPSSDVDRSQVAPRSGDRTMSSAPVGTYGGLGAVGDGSFPGLAVSASQQLQAQAPTSGPVRPLGQTSAGQPSIGQGFPSQPMLGFSGQLPLQQGQVQTSVSSTSAQALSNNNLPPYLLSAMANQFQMPGQQMLQQPVNNQSASQLAQMLSHQKQTLQASYQSSQQAFTHLQQQLQLMQPSNQSLTPQQNLQATKMQSPWAGSIPQTAATSSAPTIKPLTDSTPATSSASVAPVMSPAVASLKCNWTEHTSPDGYKYYYNSTTGESKWEKPEELTLFEQQQKTQELQQQKQHQNASVQQQQPQSQSHPQGVTNHMTPQTPQQQLQSYLQAQMQGQIRHPQQLQHATMSSAPYQAAGVAGHQNIQGFGYAQLPVAGSSMNDPARSQQGLQAAQEWMWKNKPPGS